MTTSANQSPARPTEATKKTGRWVLYHGTSTLRLKCIQHTDRLRVAPSGSKVVSLTTDQSVAEYFACVAAAADKRRCPGDDRNGVVLQLDGEKLLEEGYRLHCYAIGTDDIKASAKWDPADTHLENEIICAKDIIPLSEFLIGASDIKKSTYQTFLRHGRGAFMSRVPFTAHLECLAMETIIHHWGGEEAFPGEIDTLALAIKGIRRALNQLQQANMKGERHV
jgi:hypothetical protein